MEQTIYVIKTGNYTHHGVKNSLGGSFGTADNRMSIKTAIAVEMAHSKPGIYKVEVNGVDKGTVEVTAKTYSEVYHF